MSVLHYDPYQFDEFLKGATQARAIPANTTSPSENQPKPAVYSREYPVEYPPKYSPKSQVGNTRQLPEYPIEFVEGSQQYPPESRGFRGSQRYPPESQGSQRYPQESQGSQGYRGYPRYPGYPVESPLPLASTRPAAATIAEQRGVNSTAWMPQELPRQGTQLPAEKTIPVPTPEITPTAPETATKPTKSSPSNLIKILLYLIPLGLLLWYFLYYRPKRQQEQAQAQATAFQPGLTQGLPQGSFQEAPLAFQSSNYPPGLTFPSPLLPHIASRPLAATSSNDPPPTANAFSNPPPLPTSFTVLPVSMTSTNSNTSNTPGQTSGPKSGLTPQRSTSTSGLSGQMSGQMSGQTSGPTSTNTSRNTQAPGMTTSVSGLTGGSRGGLTSISPGNRPSPKANSNYAGASSVPSSGASTGVSSSPSLATQEISPSALGFFVHPSTIVLTEFARPLQTMRFGVLTGDATQDTSAIFRVGDVVSLWNYASKSYLCMVPLVGKHARALLQNPTSVTTDEFDTVIEVSSPTNQDPYAQWIVRPGFDYPASIRFENAGARGLFVKGFRFRLSGEINTFGFQPGQGNNPRTNMYATLFTFLIEPRGRTENADAQKSQDTPLGIVIYSASEAQRYGIVSQDSAVFLAANSNGTLADPGMPLNPDQIEWRREILGRVDRDGNIIYIGSFTQK